MTASPPWDVTAAAISGVSVATATRPILRGLGPAQHMDDHRQAGDIQQRLAGQAGGGHAGGNQHQSAGFGHRSEVWTRLITGRK